MNRAFCVQIGIFWFGILTLLLLPGENVPVKYVPNSQTPSTSVPQTPHIPSKENPSKESNIPKRNSNGINPNGESISNGSNSNRGVSENSNKEILTPIRKTSLQLANRTKAEEIELNKKNGIHNISQESTKSRTRTLSKTGNKSNETLSVIGLSILGLSVLFGLMDRKKRRN